jgi:hypothetical protein
MLNVIMLNVIMLNVIMLNVIMLNVIMLNVIMLNVIMMNVIILIVIMLKVIMLDAIMLNAIMPSVEAPINTTSVVCTLDDLSVFEFLGRINFFQFNCLFYKINIYCQNRIRFQLPEPNFNFNSAFFNQIKSNH